MKILSIHCGHDASAALVVDGKIVADVPEERFSRRKNERSFPHHSIDYCLQRAGILSEEIDCIALPEKKVSDLLRCALVMATEHVAIEFNCGLPKEIRVRSGRSPLKIGLPFYFPALRLSPQCIFFLSGHHAAHAASAYYPSGIGTERALVVTLDGTGEGISTALWRAEQRKLHLLQSYGRESSLGWFYSNVTEALGWQHGSDEWKVMGLAPYGVPKPGELKGFYPEYKNGKLTREHKYSPFIPWDYSGTRHYHGGDTNAIAKIGGKLGREGLAAEAQRVIEEQVSQLLFPWLDKEGTSILLCAGGVFLNVKMNQFLWQSGKLSRHWIYPNPGDGGLAVGAALLAHTTLCPEISCEPLPHISFGPEFSSEEIRNVLSERGLLFKEILNPAEATIPYLLENCVVGWFQGRMESGPRALGNRSILMDPRSSKNKDLINSKIKFRESFRPFCPSVLAPMMHEYFINPYDERFMTTSFQVKDEYRKRMPAVVHVDGSARPQMVHKSTHPLYYELIERFGNATGVYALLNTSFNIKGEPIVCSPRDALRTFFDSGIDVLIIDKFVIEKPLRRSSD